MFTSIRYTFEQYNDKVETRMWYERFVREHNSKEAMRIRGITPLNAATSVILCKESKFFRIRFDGELIGYARTSMSFGVPCIDDVFVLLRHRHKGHYHAMLPNLALFCDAQSVCLANFTYDKHAEFYASIGFDRVIYPTSRKDLVFVATEKAVQQPGVQELDEKPEWAA